MVIKQKLLAAILLTIATIIVLWLFWKRPPVPKPTRPPHDVVIEMRPGRLTKRFDEAAQLPEPLRVKRLSRLLVVGNVSGVRDTPPSAIVEIKKFPWKDDGVTYQSGAWGGSTNDDEQHYEVTFPAPPDPGKYVLCVRWGGQDLPFVASAVLIVTD